MAFIDFFKGQESLTTMQWILRAVVAYFFLIFVAKMMGQRSISQLRFLDFVMAILIGNILAHPLSDEKLGFKGSMLTMSVLVLLYLCLTFLSLNWKTLRTFFDPEPILLIEKGQIYFRNLNKARISLDFLLSELRKDKTEDISKVAYAFWEPGGTVSIFLDSEYQPVTSSSLSLPVKPLEMPASVIKEGRIDYRELQRVGKDESWLLQKIATDFHAKPQDILLATVTDNETMKLFFYS